MNIRCLENHAEEYEINVNTFQSNDNLQRREKDDVMENNFNKKTMLSFAPEALESSIRMAFIFVFRSTVNNRPR